VKLLQRPIANGTSHCKPRPPSIVTSDTSHSDSDCQPRSRNLFMDLWANYNEAESRYKRWDRTLGRTKSCVNLNAEMQVQRWRIPGDPVFYLEEAKEEEPFGAAVVGAASDDCASTASAPEPRRRNSCSWSAAAGRPHLKGL
jgi:hypothetical protein